MSLHNEDDFLELLYFGSHVTFTIRKPQAA